MTTRKKERENTYNIKYVQVVCELNPSNPYIHKGLQPKPSECSGVQFRCAVAGGATGQSSLFCCRVVKTLPPAWE